MSSVVIVADESVDFEIVRALRKNNFEVHAIAEDSPALPDAAVLETAVKKNALLISEDKDFGELVHRFKMAHCGILLLRLIALNSSEKASMVCHVLEQHESALQNVFSVLDERQLRIKK